MKGKRIISVLIIMVIVAVNAIPVVAAPKGKELTDAQILEEVNAYMAKQDTALELKDQVVTYQIPLSNGETVIIKHELKKVSNATPHQFATVSGTSASTNVVQTNRWYETTGYVGFVILEQVPTNYYFTQTISFVSTEGEDRNKIRCDISIGA